MQGQSLYGISAGTIEIEQWIQGHNTSGNNRSRFRCNANTTTGTQRSKLNRIFQLLSHGLSHRKLKHTAGAYKGK
jgi:hypothetical protein